MKALVFDAIETLSYRDMPEPELSAGQSLVRIQASGICGSDMHAFLGHDERRPAPLILGHEAAGVVVEGDDIGRRVTINPLVTCGNCKVCLQGRTNLCSERMIISMPPRQGAFAQFVAMRNENLVTVPEAVPLMHAVLAEPLACGWHAVRLISEASKIPMKDARCLVIGGGAIGVGGALALRAFGATEITLIETNELRRENLQSNEGLREGFTTLSDDQFIGEADVVIDAVGYSKTRVTASAFTQPGGIIAHIGLGEATGGLDIRRITLQEITFIGTYTYTEQDFRDTAQAMFDGRLGALNWADERSLQNGQSAFDDLRTGKVSEPKIVLIPEQKV